MTKPIKLTKGQKRVKTLLKKYGKDYFSQLAGKPHRRGNTFNDPEISRKAVEVRLRNREEYRRQNEIQTDPGD